MAIQIDRDLEWFLLAVSNDNQFDTRRRKQHLLSKLFLVHDLLSRKLDQAIIHNKPRALRSRTVTTDLFWLLGAVAFFVLIDNFLKVGFRQPYPGILMFFLWGVLLTRLSTAVSAPRA